MASSASTALFLLLLISSWSFAFALHPGGKSHLQRPGKISPRKYLHSLLWLLVVWMDDVISNLYGHNFGMNFANDVSYFEQKRRACNTEGTGPFCLVLKEVELTQQKQRSILQRQGSLQATPTTAAPIITPTPQTVTPPVSKLHMLKLTLATGLLKQARWFFPAL